MIDEEKVAGDLYAVYSEAVGGVNFKGDPLPAWEEFHAGPSKRKQSDAWVAVANRAIERLS